MFCGFISTKQKYPMIFYRENAQALMPSEWDEEIFDRVMEEAENFKKYAEFD